MFHWIISDTQQYLEAFKFVDLCEIELLVKELFGLLCFYKICLQIIFDTSVKQDLTLDNPQRLISH